MIQTKKLLKANFKEMADSVINNNILKLIEIEDLDCEYVKDLFLGIFGDQDYDCIYLHVKILNDRFITFKELIIEAIKDVKIFKNNLVEYIQNEARDYDDIDVFNKDYYIILADFLTEKEGLEIDYYVNMYPILKLDRYNEIVKETLLKLGENESEKDGYNYFIQFMKQD